jgi:xanthine/CO dehydrogenase XdhC/CoxF family maturation factor
MSSAQHTGRDFGPRHPARERSRVFAYSFPSAARPIGRTCGGRALRGTGVRGVRAGAQRAAHRRSMSEVMSLLRAARGLRRAGEPGLLATVVHVQGSSYRRPGARMLLTAERWVAGSISSAGLENDVLRRGWRPTHDGGAVLVTYDASAPEEVRSSLGLDADSVVQILLERTTLGGHADAVGFFERCHQAQLRGIMATVYRSDAPDVAPGARIGIASDGSWFARGMPEPVREALASECLYGAKEVGEAVSTTVWVAGASLDVLVERVRPSPRLFILGGGHDVVPLVDIARAVGWETFVCHPQERELARERFESADAVVVEPLTALLERIDASHQSLALVMTHDYERDRDALGMLLVSRVGYIGVLGPHGRTARMLHELGGVEAGQDERIHAPVGLELGAESPQEIALAIVAEMQAVLTRAPATRLRMRGGPIHAPVVGP